MSVKKLDKIVRDRVRERRLCEKCGMVGSEAHHIVSRKVTILRWDFENLMLLCNACHHSWHLGNSKWFEERYPERYEYLMSLRGRNVKKSEFVEKKLKELLDN